MLVEHLRLKSLNGRSNELLAIMGQLCSDARQREKSRILFETNFVLTWELLEHITHELIRFFGGISNQSIEL